MAAPNFSQKSFRLPPEVNRILMVRNLPFKVSAEEMFELFGQYGAIRQIRLGDTNETKGTAFVVYEDIFDAKTACERLSGYNMMGRYLIVLYYQPHKHNKKVDVARREQELRALKEAHGL
ncbi:hypothetical protein GGF31_005799 [Allomyces arbusculus]|nr:hypothetical protein GGF31_005799 [Allomyces arbusculus]